MSWGPSKTSGPCDDRMRGAVSEDSQDKGRIDLISPFNPSAGDPSSYQASRGTRESAMYVRLPQFTSQTCRRPDDR